MVARITHVQVKPEDVDESVKLFDEAVVPAAAEQEGFIGTLLLVRSDGDVFAIDLADTLEHAQAHERSGHYQSQIRRFADKIVGHPQRAFYDVKVAKGVSGDLSLVT